MVSTCAQRVCVSPAMCCVSHTLFILFWLPAFHTCLFKQTIVKTKHDFLALTAACGLVRNLNHWPASEEGKSAVDGARLLAAQLQQSRVKCNFHLLLKNIEFCDEVLYRGNTCNSSPLGLNPGSIRPSTCLWQGPAVGTPAGHGPLPGGQQWDPVQWELQHVFYPKMHLWAPVLTAGSRVLP